jgi:hypothetical protein
MGERTGGGARALGLQSVGALSLRSVGNPWSRFYFAVKFDSYYVVRAFHYWLTSCYICMAALDNGYRVLSTQAHIFLESSLKSSAEFSRNTEARRMKLTKCDGPRLGVFLLACCTKF